MFIYILIFIASCLLLIRSGTWVVGSLTRIAKSLGWREFTVSFILMAFTTSLPEFFIGLSSIFHRTPQLSFGNIIGANILNLTLGVGTAVLIAKSLKLGSQITQRTSLFTALIAFLPILLIIDGKISRIDGMILLLVLVFYSKYLFKEQKRFTKVLIDRFKRDWAQFKLFLKDLGMFLGGITLLLISSEGIVRSAVFLAQKANMSLWISGTIFVALGTTLPELTFGIRAISMGHKEMVLGNLMGSIVINSTLILGLVSLTSPFYPANLSLYFIGIIFTPIVALSFAFFARTGREITRKEALVLLGIYALFIVFQLLIK